MGEGTRREGEGREMSGKRDEGREGKGKKEEEGRKGSVKSVNPRVCKVASPPMTANCWFPPACLPSRTIGLVVGFSSSPAFFLVFYSLISTRTARVVLFSVYYLFVCWFVDTITRKPLEISPKTFRASSNSSKGGQVQKWLWRYAGGDLTSLML